MAMRGLRPFLVAICLLGAAGAASAQSADSSEPAVQEDPAPAPDESSAPQDATAEGPESTEPTPESAAEEPSETQTGTADAPTDSAPTEEASAQSDQVEANGEAAVEARTDESVAAEAGYVRDEVLEEAGLSPEADGEQSSSSSSASDNSYGPPPGPDCQVSCGPSPQNGDPGPSPLVSQIEAIVADAKEAIDSLPELPILPVPTLPALPQLPGPRAEDAAPPAPLANGPAAETLAETATSVLTIAPLLLVALSTALVGATASVGAAASPTWRRALERLLKAGVSLALFSRLSEEDLLSHPRRKEIRDFVHQNPGERLEIVRRRLGIPNGSMRHHLRILDSRNVVRVRREDGMSRLYPAGPRIEPSVYLAPIRRQMLDRLRTAPGLTQRELASAFGLSERMVSYHVTQLNEKGLVCVQRDGVAKRCFAAEPIMAPA